MVGPPILPGANVLPVGITQGRNWQEAEPTFGETLESEGRFRRLFLDRIKNSPGVGFGRFPHFGR